MTTLNYFVGGFGAAAGSMFFTEIAREHGILPGRVECKTKNLLEYKNKFFDDFNRPRAIYLDNKNEEMGTKYLNDSPIAKLFDSSNIFRDLNSNGLSSQGLFLSGDLINSVIEKTRKEIESYDHFAAFQLFFNLSDYSSGLAAGLYGKLREEYPDRLFIGHSIMTRKEKGSQEQIDQSKFNAVVTFTHIIENLDFVTLTDKESLQAVAKSEDFNKCLSFLVKGYSDYTSVQRSNGKKTCSLAKLAYNAYPRLHFYTFTKMVTDKIDDLFNPNLSFGKIIISEKDNYIGGAGIFRGNY